MTRVRLGAISFLDRNLKNLRSNVYFMFYFQSTRPTNLLHKKKKASAYSSRMKNRNVKCSFKGETNDFPSSGGGNHLDQSVLWHRDVIKLLMSLNEITCDPPAVPQHCFFALCKVKMGRKKNKKLLQHAEKNVKKKTRWRSRKLE